MYARGSVGVVEPSDDGGALTRTLWTPTTSNARNASAVSAIHLQVARHDACALADTPRLACRHVREASLATGQRIRCARPETAIGRHTVAFENAKAAGGARRRSSRRAPWKFGKLGSETLAVGLCSALDTGRKVNLWARFTVGRSWCICR